MLDQCAAPKELKLKKGTQVMLVENPFSELVNKTVGISSIATFTVKVAGQYNYSVNRTYR